MKRYFCTVATGIVLALVGTGTAAAGLPLPGGSGTQLVTFGDQTVGEQRNDADVTQAQGNGNLNIAPAVAIFGNAGTWNAQGNGNEATANIDQSNSVEQSQSSTQEQSSAGCCDGQSQAGQQTVSGGDQTVGEQKNDADVEQWQGNGNVNVSPAIALFGDAETANQQGNGNDADATVTQSNDATQSQSSTQKQYGGARCCDGRSQAATQETTFGDQSVDKQRNDADVTQAQGNGNLNIAPAVAIFGNAGTWNAQGNGNEATANIDQSNSVEQSQSSTQEQSLEPHSGCESKRQCSPKGHSESPTWKKQKGDDCCDGSSQAATQETTFGDQTVGEQKNNADVTQKQGNGNVNVSPAASFGGKHESCDAKCKGSWRSHGDDAKTISGQGNGNTANAWVDQSNAVTQTQEARQFQPLAEWCKGLVTR